MTPLIFRFQTWEGPVKIAFYVSTSQDNLSSLINVSRWLCDFSYVMLHLCFCLGGPAAPVPRITEISPTFLLLEWDPPFTWPYTNILHYSLSVNTSLEDWNHTLLMNTSVEIRSTDINELEGMVYTFSVSATNEIAEGEQGQVTGGFSTAGTCTFHHI